MYKDFEKEIALHESAIAELRAEQEAWKSIGADKRMATMLHEILCNYNHTDGCSWSYEFDAGIENWRGSAHMRWLEKVDIVRNMLPEWTDDGIINIIRAVKNL